MILKSLKLQNIRSYNDEEVVFPEGSTLLSGDIGAGKSTILMAVEFALFGIMRAELSGSSLLRNGKNSGVVELNLVLDGKDVTIKRVLKRSSAGVKQDAGLIVIDGVQSDLTPQEIKSKVIDLMGYPADVLTSAKSLIFRYTVYTPQEEMKKIVFDDPKDRLDNLRKIFGIDKYKTIVSNADLFSKKLGEEKRVLSERIIDLEEKNQKRTELQREIDALKENHSKLQPQISTVMAELENKIKKVEHNEKLFNDLNRLRNEFSVVQVKISEKETQKKRIELELGEIQKSIGLINKDSGSISEISIADLEKQIEESQKEYDEKLIQLSSFKSKKENFLEQESSAKSELEQFKVKLDQLKQKKENLLQLKDHVSEKHKFDEKLKETNKEIVKLKENIAATKAWYTAASELSKTMDTIKECPLCHQPIFEGQKESIKNEQSVRISNFDEQIKISTLKKDSFEEELKEIEDRIKEFSEREKEMERISGELSQSDSVEKNYNERKVKVDELKEKIVYVAKKIDEFGNLNEVHEKIALKKKELEKAKEYKFLKDSLQEKQSKKDYLSSELSEIAVNIEKLNSERENLSSEIKKYEKLEIDLSSSRKEVDQVQENLKRLEMEKLSFSKDIENRTNLCEMIQKDIDDKNKTKKYIDELSEKRIWLKEKLVPFVKLVESHIMQKIYEEFDSYFNQWVSVLLEDESLNARLEADFTPKVEQNGFEMSIADLSGGEKTSFALAYRLALNKVINDVLSAIKTKEIIILDEPTDGFSSEQLDKMRDVLEQLNSVQTIIVSHEPKLESFVQNIIRIEKSHHVSRVLS